MIKKVNTKLKVNDLVIVISGKDKGKKGKILKFSKNYSRVLVEGINIVKKTMKKTQENQSGGIISQEAMVHVSNLMYFDESLGKKSKIGYRFNSDGKKERFFKITEKK